jgi:hypothetical protein
MMMNKYTYVVNHGDESPRIGAGMEVNGGTLMAVCFCDQLEQNETARDLLEVIFLETDDSNVARKIQKVLDLI